MKLLILSVILLSMAGCSRDVIKYKTIEVKVPVNICTKPENIDRPILPLKYINTFSTDEDVVKAYKSSIKVLQNYSIKLESALEVYK